MPFGVFVTFSVIIMIFQYNISQLWETINYYDEIFSIIIFIIFLKRNKIINSRLMKILFLISATVTIGLLGNILYSFQDLPIAIIADIFSVIKVPMVVLTISSS